jgi:hypothetical protein
MALQTDLNVSPYYDDFDPTKSYHRILFQPGVAVQARELNQLQSILQNQIEKFGDNIFKRGTIIEGCNIVLHNNLPYIKIKDVETDGTPVNVSQYNNLYVKNASNVSAFIVKTAVGYESRSPNLNTLFVKYNSSGNTGNAAVFAADETLTVFNPSYPIFHMKVNDGSTGFSNSDTIAVVSAIAVQNSTGGSAFAGGAFNVNDVIQNGVANATIIEANNTANASALILKIKPLAIDLQTANTVKWRFTAGETIRNATTSVSANIAGTVGAGATGSLTTDSLGKIVSIAVTNLGAGYYIQPHVTTSITSNGATTTAAINQLSITGQNYLTNITAANSAQLSIGFGYGMSVNEGTIYQKGFFSRVEPQLTVVNKYSNTGFTKSVGFYTSEAIINSNQDATLLDNATGSFNYAAPGADRLKLSPVLTVLDKVDADANTDFLPIVEFADGSAYKQTKQTVYNVLGDEMAKRTYEESGNYVLDQFNLTTKDSTVFTETPSVFKIYIDPGLAYINGYRVETVANYTANIAKGTDTVSNVETSLKIGYGNFIRVKELAGVFEFNYGAQIDLYDTAAGFLTSTPTGAITPVGNKIGVARIRSLVHDSGEPGAAGSVYRMYLFDIVMSTGKNFANVRSVYYSGSTKGIADCLLNAGGLTTILNDSADSSLLFKTVNATKYANNITYTYRTMNQTEQANTTGYIDLNVGAGEYFPYNAGGTLNDTEERDILVIPRSNYQAQTNAAGNVSTSATSPTVTGITGTNFVVSFKTGDYIKIANSTASVVKQVWQVINATSMNMYSNVGTTFAYANAVLYFPNNIPISFGRRSERTITVAANGQQLTINLANSLANSTGSVSSANVTVLYNVTANNTSTGSKVSNRGIYTRIRIANNASATPGPWALGVADAFRLRNVYKANGASIAKTFNANSGVVASFVSIPNNPFANGDSLVYTTGTGGTILTGLANNTTYYAVLANSSGSKFSSTRNGSALTITASAISETHTFTGLPLYFAPDTYGVADITNDFYIDNNQTEDYLDISYLYKKPGRTATVTNDVYLVKYDAFTSGTGVKTVSSYNVNDAANLTTLSTGSEVHTMEIPQATGISGKYYDLRDRFDFRPVSSNTIPLITELSNTSIVNPTEPTDANRFSVVEQKFPLPNSELTANISYYVGRNDRVVLDKNARFTVLKGVPGALNAFPDEPRDSITIQYLTIPPYPSLPAALSAEMAEIVDTRVANEKYGRRKDNFKITTPLDRNQQARIQIKNYQMNDIASLEKRIKDLEYYVSFTLVEAITNSKFIPSSASNAIDRFKFGFFVDPFTDLSFCDINSPEFKATVTDNTLGTQKTEQIFQLIPDSGSTDSILTMPYVEYNLISQNDATDGAIEVVMLANTVANTTTANTTTANTTTANTDITIPVVSQKTAEVTEQQKTFANQPEDGSVYEDFFYVFSTLTGPAELYAIYRDNYMAFEISQGTSAAGSYTTTITSASAQAIGAAAYASKGITGLNAQYSGGVAESIDILNIKSVYAAGIPYVEDSQKILWTHDPSLGIYVRVRVYKGGRHGASQGKAGSYGFKMFYPSDTITTRTVSTSTPTNFQYTGTVFDVNPKTFTLSFTLGYFDLASNNMDAYIADAQRFVISVTGLKPSTYHQFVFDNIDKTDKCNQIVKTGTNTGTGLLSDAYGTLTFDFYYDAGITEATSDLMQQNKLAASIAGPKSFVVQSYGDGNSKAAGSIEMKYYSGINDATTGSYDTLNVTATTTVGDTKVNDYNYNTGTLPDYTTNTKTDTNVQTVDWTGFGNGYLRGLDFTNLQIGF